MSLSSLGSRRPRRPLPVKLPERRGGDNCRRLSLPIALAAAAEAASVCLPPLLRNQGEAGEAPTVRSDPEGPLPAFTDEGQKLAASAAPARDCTDGGAVDPPPPACCHSD